MTGLRRHIQWHRIAPMIEIELFRGCASAVMVAPNRQKLKVQQVVELWRTEPIASTNNWQAM
jgi:hypothetical protein